MKNQWGGVTLTLECNELQQQTNKIKHKADHKTTNNMDVDLT